MVKKHFCDRCGVDIKNSSDEFEDMFNSVSAEFEKKTKITQPELCKKCLVGYQKIISEVNKKIIDYVRGK